MRLKKSIWALQAALLVLGVVFTWWMTAHTDRELRRGLLQQASIVANATDPDRIKVLEGNLSDLEKPAYLELKTRFAAIRQSHPGYRFIYLMGRRPDGTLFIQVDDSPVGHPEEAPAGTIYQEAPEGFHRVMQTGIASVEGPFADRWGSFVSACVPVTDPQTGRILALLAIDTDARSWVRVKAAEVALPVAFTLVLLIGMQVMLAFLRRSNHPPRPVLRRLLPPLAGMVVVLLAGGGLLLWWQHDSAMTRRLAALDASITNELQVDQKNQAAIMKMVLQPIVTAPRVLQALRDADGRRLLADWQEVFQSLQRENGLTHFYFIDRNRAVLARLHRPEHAGEQLHRFTLLEAERTGKIASGIEIGSLGTLVLRVVQPVLQDGELLGFVEMGKEVVEILQERHRQSGSHLAVVLHKKLLDRQQWETSMRHLGREAEWDRLPGGAIIYASQGRLPDAFAPLANHPPTIGPSQYPSTREIAHNGGTWRVSTRPFVDAAGKEIGWLLVMTDVSADKKAFLQLATVGASAAGVILSALLGLLVVWLRRTDHGLQAQQAALIHSEQRLAATLASIGDGVISTDAAGRVVSLNRLAVQLTGWQDAEAAGCPIEEIFQIVHAETRAVAENPVALSLRDGVTVDLANHTVLIRRDGTEYHIADSCAPIRDQSGTVIGAVLVFRDVTEAYQQRQQLQEERQRLDQVLWGTGVGTWEWNVQTGATRFNERWAEMVGYTLAELAPVSIATWEALLYPEDGQRTRDALERHFCGEAEYYECEVRMRHQHGHWIWILARGKVVSWTEDGQPLWMAGTHLDITGRKQAEIERRASEERLQSVFRAAPTGIGVVKDRVFQEVNRRICEMTGYGEEELVGQSGRMLYPSQDDFDYVGREKYEQIRTMGTGIIETRWRRKDGALIDVLLASTPLDPTDWSKGVTFTALDISARKQAEQTLRENERQLSNWMGNLPGMAYRCRNDRNWTMDFVSQGSRVLTGYAPEELQECYIDIIHPDDREHVWQTVQNALRERQHFQVEFRIRTSGGAERWVWEQGVGIFADGDVVEAIEGIIIDITERKQMEKQLAESEARYRSLFENNHAVMMVIDPATGAVVDANPAAAAWYGWRREELTCKNMGDINTLTQQEIRVAMARAQCQEKGSFVFRHRRADGSVRDVEVYSGPVQVAHRSLLYSIVHDITAKKRAEEALERRILALTRPLGEAGNITFDELFNLNDIQGLQDDFARATGVGSMIVAPDGTPITAPSNFCRLCRDFVRQTEPGRANCQRSDAELGKPSEQGPTIARCLSAGLWDAGAAILVDGRHLANWLVGQVRDPGHSEAEIRAYAREIGGDEEQMVEAFWELPAMSRDQFTKVAQALYTLARQLSLSAYQNVQQARFIAEQKQYQEKIALLAHHDQLTGLANRTLFAERFEQASHHALRTHTRLALCVLDLDSFKAINDTHGHRLGDQLLCEVAHRLQRAVRAGDTVCRIGGDEFIILFTDLQESGAVSALIQKVLLCFEARFNLDNTFHAISASMGIAMFPEDGRDFSTLFEYADAAMYYAKESGRNNVQFFHQEINQRIQHRLTVEKELRQALLDDHLEVHYQPIIRLPEKRMGGMEALVRWRHPERGLIPPGEFIAVAEESNLIVTLGQRVLQHACRDMRTWHQLGLPTLPISVNVSPRQLFQADFPDFVARMLRYYALAPQQLELEVTESIFLESSASVERVMNALKDIGVGLVLDDFGTGYSSLSFLKRFRIDKLKIDRAFLEQVCHSQQDAILVTTIIRMAQSLGIQVVAEGVETAEQSAFLIDQKCELAQGYYFSRPQPLAAVQELLGRLLLQDGPAGDEQGEPAWPL